MLSSLAGPPIPLPTMATVEKPQGLALSLLDLLEVLQSTCS